jgi:CRP/FNR family transcriptional regulator, cyclic AMP receptor protein
MLGRDHKVDLLRTVPLFSACSRRELRRIAAIADEIDVDEGKVLARQGDPGRELFILLEGTVKVERYGEQVNALGPGDFVGESALILGKARNATITTTSPVRVLVITDNSFRRLLREDPKISTKVLETAAARMPPDESGK